MVSLYIAAIPRILLTLEVNFYTNWVSGTAEMALSRMGPRSRVRANSAEKEPQSGGLGRRGENWEGRKNSREIALYIRGCVRTWKPQLLVSLYIENWAYQ